MYEDIANELKKNTEVVERSFRNHNLQALQISYVTYSNGDGDCELLIEISDTGDPLDEDVTIKANAYDQNGQLIMMKQGFLFTSTFSGYDTLSFLLNYDRKFLQVAKSVRIYVT